jgi:hypothetical protein
VDLQPTHIDGTAHPSSYPIGPSELAFTDQSVESKSEVRVVVEISYRRGL